MRLLNLCSGTGSVSRQFLEAVWDIVEVDWDHRYGPTHCVNLLMWVCPYEPAYFDVVWASPDCTQYSRARTKANTPRNLEQADALVRCCLDLIAKLKPKLWFLENPDSGLLKTRGVVEGLPFVRVDYCMYGCLYRKRTRIWTNADWQPRLCGRTHIANGRHTKTVQRGPNKTCSNDKFSRDELHRLPSALCEDIFQVCASMSLVL